MKAALSFAIFLLIGTSSFEADAKELCPEFSSSPFQLVFDQGAEVIDANLVALTSGNFDLEVSVHSTNRNGCILKSFILIKDLLPREWEGEMALKLRHANHAKINGRFSVEAKSQNELHRISFQPNKSQDEWRVVLYEKERLVDGELLCRINPLNKTAIDGSGRLRSFTIPTNDDLIDNTFQFFSTAQGFPICLSTH